MADGNEFEIDPRAFLAPADGEPGEPVDQESASSSSADGIVSLKRIEQELTDVEDALVRLDEGRYGLCDACGAEIADAWLAEHPTERRCADHRPTDASNDAATGGSVGDSTGNP